MLREACTQPQCALRSADAAVLADWIVGILAGEDVRERVAPQARIQRDPRCVACVQRILHEREPFPTLDELARLDDAGRWSHRRRRRHGHRLRKE